MILSGRYHRASLNGVKRLILSNNFAGGILSKRYRQMSFSKGFCQNGGAVTSTQVNEATNQQLLYVGLWRKTSAMTRWLDDLIT